MEQAGAVRVVPVAAGLGLALAGLVALWLLPTGPAEFAYFPMDMAWPWGLGRGWGVAELGAHLIGALLLGPAVGLVAWGLAPRLPVWRPDEGTRQRVGWLIVGASVALAALIMFFVVAGRPLVPDELSYVSQARQLASGRLMSPVPAGFTTEVFDIIAPSGGGVTAKYLPGEALVQIPGVLLGLPALLHVPLLALALLMVWRTARMHAGQGVGLLVLGLVALSPMLILVTGTGLSHTAAFTAIALAALGEALTLRSRPWTGALLVGVGVAVCAWVRPQVAVPVGGVFALFTAVHLLRSKPLALLALGAPMVLCVLGVAAYDLAVTGEALKLPWSVSGERWGFGQPVDGVDYWHGPVEAVQNTLTNGVRFSTWWIGWPSGLVLMWMFLRVGRPMGGLRSWVVASAAQLAFMIPYFSPGIFDVGPIYHLEGILGASVLGALALAGLSDTRPRLTVGLAGAWLVLGTLPALAWGTARLDRLLDHVHGPAEQALAQLPDAPTLLLVETDCTGRLGLGSMMLSFPRRTRLTTARHLVLPRPPPEHLEAFLAYWGARECLYTRRHPVERHVLVQPCSEAMAELTRPLPADLDLARCPREHSFAERLGWRPPLSALPVAD